MADRKSKKVKPSCLRASSAEAAQASARTRIQRSLPARRWLSATASPNSCSNAARSSERSSSVGSASASGAAAASSVVGSASTDDNRFSLPSLRHVLVEDALLQQDDALEQRLGSGRTAGNVHVDRDHLVDALGDGVAVPVGTAAVGARTHGDHVLRVG